MGTEIAKRNVKVETTGAFMVEQENMKLSDLRDFVNSAEAHGVTDDTTVHIKQGKETWNREKQEYDYVTKLMCEAPVMLTYGSVGAKPVVDPRKRRLRRKIIFTGGVVLTAVLALPFILIGIGLFLDFVEYAWGLV